MKEQNHLSTDPHTQTAPQPPHPPSWNKMAGKYIEHETYIELDLLLLFLLITQ